MHQVVSEILSSLCVTVPPQVLSFRLVLPGVLNPLQMMGNLPIVVVLDGLDDFARVLDVEQVIGPVHHLLVLRPYFPMSKLCSLSGTVSGFMGTLLRHG